MSILTEPDKTLEALKPCPFCGGEAERVDIEDGNNAGGSFIHCTVCDASGNVEFEFKENFVSNWNRRAATSAGEAGLEMIASEARRYASFYPEASDGRNTFIIFAEWIERLSGPVSTGKVK